MDLLNGIDVSGGAPIFVGGSGEPSAMRMLLAALAACDVDLVANRAALLGVKIESLTVQATGHFNVLRYLGLDAPDSPGYDRIGYTVRLKTQGATSEQLADLRRACEEASPVGDTISAACSAPPRVQWKPTALDVSPDTPRGESSLRPGAVNSVTSGVGLRKYVERLYT
jgi:uncharacterized OsmC-like protein